MKSKKQSGFLAHPVLIIAVTGNLFTKNCLEAGTRGPCTRGPLDFAHPAHVPHCYATACPHHLRVADGMSTYVAADCDWI